jgi:membrane fusion protein (multidrug efflux system)
VIGALLVALAGGAGGYAWATHGIESTDDAQIDAEVVSVPARARGLVAAVLFTDNQRVAAGDLLVRLDDAEPRARLAQAQAALANARAVADAADAEVRLAQTKASGNKKLADAAVMTSAVGARSARDHLAEAQASIQAAELTLAQAESDRTRAEGLFAQGAIPRAEMDRATTARDLAEANVAAARARLATLASGRAEAESRVVEATARADASGDVATVVAQAEARARAAHAQVDAAAAALALAELDVSYTEIRAPHDGTVSKRTVSEGQTVAPGQAVVQLVTPSVWITANFKETQLEDMKVGQPVDITVDAFPHLALRGSIESFSGATGSRFSLLPPDNAAGNYTKVVQRVPVRVKLEAAPSVELRPGMSAEVSVDTR